MYLVLLVEKFKMQNLSEIVSAVYAEKYSKLGKKTKKRAQEICVVFQGNFEVGKFF